MRFNFASIAAVMAAALVAPALAADLPAKSPAYKAPAAIAANWSGFYLGLNGGYGWGRDERHDPVAGGGFWTNGPGGAFGGTETLHPKGGVFGGQIGYNFQAGPWVFGAEGNFQGASLKEDKTSTIFPATDSWHSKISAIVTATGRIGYALNAWLPYLRGGYAAAKLKARMDDNTAAADFVENSSWYSGWTIGGGVEYMLTPNWILGAEYDYMDFDWKPWTGTTTTAAGGFVRKESLQETLSTSTVTVRVSYKFGPQ